MLLALALLALLLAAGPTAAAPHKPHIVYFLVDDLGFSNVGYNNRPNPEPLTPHIDALHDGGAELTNYYVYRFCSPTRSSFISGRLPYHVNQENHPPASPGGGVPLEMTTIADKLNASGYLGHQIGKWHCGMSCTGHLPVHRGFRRYGLPMCPR
jgi:arylsulfatase A-like enzyme